jgi:hypothetical protein
MGFISYPRTAAELKAVLSLGYKEVIKLLRLKKLRVNLRAYLRHLFKESKYNDQKIHHLNKQLFNWQEKRKQAGLSDAAIVYHHSGVRLLHGFTIKMVNYERKVDRLAYQKEREKEFGRVRKAWLKDIAINNAQELEVAGISRSEIEKMAKYGKTPTDAEQRSYQVHHRLPLDDGGTNDTKNFILIRNDVEHRAVHGYYNPGELLIDRLAYGSTAEVALPMPPEDAIVYPNPARGYVAEIVPHADFLDIYHED